MCQVALLPFGTLRNSDYRTCPPSLAPSLPPCFPFSVLDPLHPPSLPHPHATGRGALSSLPFEKQRSDGNNIAGASPHRSFALALVADFAVKNQTTKLNLVSGMHFIPHLLFI